MFQSYGQDTPPVASLGKHHSRREPLPPGIAAGLPPGAAFAQDFPSRPIRFTVGVTSGGSIDPGARVVAMPLQQRDQTTAEFFDHRHPTITSV